MSEAEILVGDARARLAEIEDGSIRCCVTSPPYFGLRDYGNDAQMGLEATPDAYVKELVGLFGEVRRVLAHDGTLWLNLGDSYAGGKSGRADSGDEGWFGGEYQTPKHNDVPTGLKPKDLIGIPWRVALALQADGWYLRSDIIWAKPNPMPESVTDRPTKSHEHLFLFAKSARYYYNSDAIKEPAVAQNAYGDSDDPMHSTKSGNEYEFTGFRNKRDVWTIGTKPFAGAHFAVMPEALVEPCVLAGSRDGDTVLDPFAGSGTVGVVALRHQRNFIGVELNPEYAQMAVNRINDSAPLLNSAILSAISGEVGE